MLAQNESLDKYQLTQEKTYDFMKIIKLLESQNGQEKLVNPDIFKQYKHSLFSPILSYIIEYLNENGSKTGFIGKATIKGLNVLYSVINRKIYELFMDREKGQIDENETKIDFNSDKENENYFLSKSQKEKCLDFSTLKDIAIALIDEKDDSLKNKNFDNLIKIYEYKKREVISTFRMGYSTQERLISMLIENTGNNLKELPNIMFFEKNTFRNCYYEIDRVFLAKENISYSNINVYYEAEFSENVIGKKNKLEKGQIFMIEKNSLNFVEIKSSIKGLMKEINKEDKNNNQNETNIFNKTPSNISSSVSKTSEDTSSRQYRHVNEFIDLYKTFNVKYEQINVIYIIDQYFSKDFFDEVEKFIDKYVKKDEKIRYPFKLKFIQIDSDSIFIHEKNVLNAIKDDFEQFKSESKVNYENLQKEYTILNEKYENYKNLKEESEKNYQKLKKESDKNYEDLNKKYSDLMDDSKEKDNKLMFMQKQLDNITMKDIMKKSKKNNQRKILFKFGIQNVLENIKNITSEKNNAIIGNYYIDNFVSVTKTDLNKKYYDNILDLKSFVKLDSSIKDQKIINQTIEKYKNHLDIYLNLKFGSLMFFADNTFFKQFFEKCLKMFENKNFIIQPVLDDLFLFELNPKNDNDSNSYFHVNLPGVLGSVNLKNCKNISNLVEYYFKVKNLNLTSNIIDFPLYNPNIELDQYFLSYIEGDVTKEETAVIIYNDLTFDQNELMDKSKKNYRNILMVYERNNSSKEIIESIVTFFIKEKKYTIFNASKPLFKIIHNSETKQILEGEKNRIIYDIKHNRIQYLYAISDQKSGINLNKNRIVDKNIIDLCELLSEKGNLKNILIKEPLSIISLYLFENFKGSKITLVDSKENKRIKEILRTGYKIRFQLTKENLLDYLPKSKCKYDAIIIENDDFPDEINEQFPTKELLLTQNLIKIKNALNLLGKIYFHVILPNSFSYESVIKEIDNVFYIEKKVQLFPLEFWIVCISK